MKKILLILLSLLCLTISCPATVQAANFSSASIRPDRIKTVTHPGNILIQARVNVSEIEDAVQVVAPTGYSISGTAGNFTVSTSGLPNGVTAWPGMGTATSVSGQTITFPSSDLTAGTTYGFFITGGFPNNPTAGAGDQYIWQLKTRVSGSDSSSANIPVAILANDQINITASISPPATAFSTDLTTNDDIDGIEQETVINYTVTYGSTYASSTPITLEVDWTKGTPTGSSTASIDIVQYVPNSASTAYNGTTPTIDTVNRIITWDIASLPANTQNLTVTFQLKTTSSYTSSTLVNFDVNSRVSAPTLTIDSTLSHTYQYIERITPTPIPGPTNTTAPSSSSQTSEPTTIVTSTPILVNPIRFENYQVTGLTHDSASIRVQLNRPAQLTVRYGLSPKQLLNRLQIPESKSVHIINLADLTRDTTYYLMIDAVFDGQTHTSDILMITTARDGLQIDLHNSNFSVFSGGLHLSTFGSNQTPTILSAVGQSLELTLQLGNSQLINSVTITALDTEELYLGTLTQTQTGFFTGKIIIPSIFQTLPVMMTIETNDSLESTTLGVFSKLIFYLRPSPPITVLDKQTQLPIERASVLLKRLNFQTRLFEVLPAPNFLSHNPLISDHFGQTSVTLPEGEYEITVSATGYQPHTQVLEVNQQKTDSFPVFSLAPNDGNLLTQIPYLFETVIHKIQHLDSFIKHESQSSALFRLSSFLIITILSPVTLLSLLARSHFSLDRLIHSFRTHFHVIFRSSNTDRHILSLRVIDRKTNKPINNVAVIVIDDSNQTVLSQATTHFNGHVSISTDTIHKIKIIASANHYIQEEKLVELTATNTALNLTLEKNTNKIAALAHNTYSLITWFFSQIFELSLFASLCLQIYFLATFGYERVLPFLVLTMVNLIFWLIQAHSRYLFHRHA